MSDEPGFEPFEDDIAALIAAGRHELVPEAGAAARIERRVANALEPRPRQRIRIAVAVAALAACVAAGFGMHALIGSAAKPAVARREPTSPVPPGTAAFAGFGDSMGRDQLDDAVARLGRDDAAGALAALDAQRRHHPTGPLSELRDALTIEALARLGRAADARVAAEAFATRYPHSLLAPAVRDALDRIRD